MKILSGKDAGDGYQLRQFANDWITVDGNGRENLIVKPDNAQVEGPEFDRMLESWRAWQASAGSPRHGGQFWRTWRLNEDGTFHNVNRPVARPHRRRTSDGVSYMSAATSPRAKGVDLDNHGQASAGGGAS